ncbi:MAG: NUDIX hydrolase [Candidatus Promineifilaceae bacterium]
MTAIIAQVRQALALADFDAAAAQRKMAPINRSEVRPANLSGAARLGGVLALFYRRAGIWHIVLTRRRDDMPSHPGQISFPGGRNRAPESVLETALRETEEEIGVTQETVEILGALTPIYVPPSDYEVHPFVARYTGEDGPTFRAQPREVAQVIEAPLAALLDPGARVEETRHVGGQDIRVPYFALGEHKVWGATAVMLSELVERLRVVGD